MFINTKSFIYKIFFIHNNSSFQTKGILFIYQQIYTKEYKIKEAIILSYRIGNPIPFKNKFASVSAENLSKHHSAIWMTTNSKK